MPVSPGLLAQGLLELARTIFTTGGPSSFREAAARFVSMGGAADTAERQVRQAVNASFQLLNELRANGTTIVPETAYIPFPGRMAEGNNYMLNIYVDLVDQATGEVLPSQPYTLTSSRPLAADQWNEEIAAAADAINEKYSKSVTGQTVMGAFRKVGT